MSKVSKRMKAFKEKVQIGKAYSIDEAVGLLTELSKVKFKESIDVSINLGVDPRKSDQVIRGATVLPHGTGKDVRVAVFAQGDKAAEATAAGADIVGMDDLAASIKEGNLDFQVCVATPDAMRVVGQLGQILGPRGLMPNPRLGTVTMDVTEAVSNAKAGQVRYRTDKNGIIHTTIGKADFEASQLQENLEALLEALKKAKPANAKGAFIKKISLSTTMGGGVKINQSSLTKA